MRPTTLFTFLAASVAVLSPVYAAPVPVGSEGTKRECIMSVCRDAELPSTTGNTSPLMTLVSTLMTALSTFKDSQTFTNATTIDLADLASKPEPVADIELLTDSV